MPRDLPGLDGGALPRVVPGEARRGAVVHVGGLKAVVEIKEREHPETSAKREAAKRWVAAVNNWDELGWWAFLVCWNPSASATS